MNKTDEKIKKAKDQIQAIVTKFRDNRKLTVKDKTILALETKHGLTYAAQIVVDLELI